jgi:hypothetical protein
MTFDVDGRIFQQPDEATIAREFESIDKRTGFRGGGISLVTLSRSKGNSLTTSGHPIEGWCALLYETDGITRSANPPAPLSQEKTIHIFQSYARGDASWEKDFQWDVIAGKLTARRIVVWLVILVIVLFFARNCSK